MPPNQKMELLAPAGNLATALAAFDAGADAVYAGMKKFNARERGENFTADDMARLTTYARANNKKVYVTFNTLVKESELDSAADALAELDFMRPDALIVQDAGIVRMIREFFPALRIHASTQMALHDSDAVRTAAEMGASRVILERQVTLDELRIIAKRSPVELEVFTHGALCCCLSGTCLLSSWLGGASGNRGRCKQPCRRLWESSDGHMAFHLSTRDLAAFSLIPEFRKMGIASLKIEGRLRRADYVSAVVSAYRTLLDAPEDDFESLLDETAAKLDEACSREPSMGFYSPASAQKLIRQDAPGGVGQFCGHVGRVDKGFFEAELVKKIHIGDTLRVQNESGDEGFALTLLDLSVGGRRMMKALPGEVCVIGCKGKEVFPGGLLYRIGKTHNTMEKRLRALPAHKPVVPVSLTLEQTSLSAETSGGKRWSISFPPLENAQKFPLSKEKLIETFTSPVTSRFMSGSVTAEISGEWFVPSGTLKQWRRDFYSWLDSALSPESMCMDSIARSNDFKKHHAEMKASGNVSADVTLTENGDEYVLPFFTPETNIENLTAMVEKRLASGKRIFRATSLSHFALLKKYPEMILKVMPPLPAANSMALLEFKRLGAASAVLHIELETKEAGNTAAKAPLPVELYTFGRPVIFATRAGITKAPYISDQIGEKFRIEHTPDLSVFYPEKPFKQEPVEGASSLTDLRHAEIREKENAITSPFNTIRGLA